MQRVTFIPPVALHICFLFSIPKLQPPFGFKISGARRAFRKATGQSCPILVAATSFFLKARLIKAAGSINRVNAFTFFSRFPETVWFVATLHLCLSRFLGACQGGIGRESLTREKWRSYMWNAFYVLVVLFRVLFLKCTTFTLSLHLVVCIFGACAAMGDFRRCCR